MYKRTRAFRPELQSDHKEPFRPTPKLPTRETPITIGAILQKAPTDFAEFMAYLADREYVLGQILSDELRSKKNPEKIAVLKKTLLELAKLKQETSRNFYQQRQSARSDTVATFARQSLVHSGAGPGGMGGPRGGNNRRGMNRFK